jgi:hypothetical protein
MLVSHSWVLNKGKQFMVLRECNMEKLLFTTAQSGHKDGRMGVDRIKIGVADPDQFLEMVKGKDSLKFKLSYLKLNHILFYSWERLIRGLIMGFRNRVWGGVW